MSFVLSSNIGSLYLKSTTQSNKKTILFDLFAKIQCILHKWQSFDNFLMYDFHSWIHLKILNIMTEKGLTQIACR